MLELLSDPQAWLAFATLSALEIVLGIDNIVFIAILADKLPAKQRQRARKIGLGMAMFVRVGLLASLAWIIQLTAPLFTVIGNEISGRDLVLVLGGLFLLAKSTHEIHNSLEGEKGGTSARVRPSMRSVLIQIVLLDIVFSLDSVITAVGMVDELAVMIAAVIFAVGVMMVFAGSIGDFVGRHPTIKILALSFLMLIGAALIAEGFDHHIPKGYIYFAMCYALAVEMLNQRARKKAATPPVELHSPYTPAE